MDSPSNLYRVYQPYQKRLSIYQSTTRKNFKFSNKYQYKLGVQCLPQSTRKTNHKHMFGRFATGSLLKSCSLLAYCTPSPSFMNVHQGIPLFRYIGRQFVLLVSIIRRMKQRGQSLQHLQCRLLNILSFQLFVSSRKLEQFKHLYSNIVLSFNLMFTIHGR